jgi:hypothetical protein
MSDTNHPATLTKVCTKCDTVRAIEQFHRNKAAQDGRMQRCKLCVAAAKKVEYAQRKAGTFVSSTTRVKKEQVAKRVATVAHYNDRIVDNLDDAYVRRKLVKQTGLAHDDIPAVAVEVKRLQLQILREAREQERLRPLFTHKAALGEVLTGLKTGAVSPDEATEYANQACDDINEFLKQLGKDPRQTELEID